MPTPGRRFLERPYGPTLAFLLLLVVLLLVPRIVARFSGGCSMYIEQEALGALDLTARDTQYFTMKWDPEAWPSLSVALPGGGWPAGERPPFRLAVAVLHDGELLVEDDVECGSACNWHRPDEGFVLDWRPSAPAVDIPAGTVVTLAVEMLEPVPPPPGVEAVLYASYSRHGVPPSADQ